MASYGEFNPALTAAVKRVASATSDRVFFSEHAFAREGEREVDHADVWVCLKRGNVYGPEVKNGQLRANVVHRGLHVRVAIGGLDHAQGDWARLQTIVVCTVIRTQD